tara:strand:+ start:142 stop:348 length:207 start_codon:yes stop_codon:yes gene_type:complete
MDLKDRFSEEKVYEKKPLIGGGKIKKSPKKHNMDENWRKLYVELKEKYKQLEIENKKLKKEIKKVTHT